MTSGVPFPPGRRGAPTDGGRRARIFAGGLWPASRAAGLVLVALLSACGGSGETRSTEGGNGLTGTLMITGSSTVAPLASEIGRRFEEAHPGVRVDVQSGGSAQGLADLQRGLAQVAMVSRDLPEGSEDLQVHPIALDGIALVVHRENPVNALGPDEVRDIFTGRVRDWSDVGGAPGPITVVNKAEGRGTLTAFLSYFELETGDLQGQGVVGDNQHGIRSVAGNRGAVSYLSIGAVEQEMERRGAVRMVPLGTSTPSSSAVKAGEYPLVRSLDLVTRPEGDPLAEAYLDFIRSGVADDLFEELGFVPAAG